MNRLRRIAVVAADWIGCLLLALGIAGLLVLSFWIVIYRFRHKHETETELFLDFWLQITLAFAVTMLGAAILKVTE